MDHVLVEVNEDLYLEAKDYIPDYWFKNIFCVDPTSDKQLTYYINYDFIDSEATLDKMLDDIRDKHVNSVYRYRYVIYALLASISLSMFLFYFPYPVLFMVAAIACLTIEYAVLASSGHNLVKVKYANSIIKDIGNLTNLAHMSRQTELQSNLIVQYKAAFDDVERSYEAVKAEYVQFINMVALKDNRLVQLHLANVQNTTIIDTDISTQYSENIH